MRTLKELAKMRVQYLASKNPGFPSNYIPSKNYKDDSANALTSAIIDAITFSGGFATRVNTVGIWDEKLQRYRPSTTRKGMSDVIACVDGLFIAIEVKFGSDRQSDEQKNVEADIVRSGGLYKIVKTYSQFSEWWEAEVKKRKGTAV